MQLYGDAAVSQLTVKLHPPQYKDMSRIMPGAVMDFDGIVGVMQSSIVGQFYKSTKGHKATPKRCALLSQNAGMVFIPT